MKEAIYLLTSLKPAMCDHVMTTGDSYIKLGVVSKAWRRRRRGEIGEANQWK